MNIYVLTIASEKTHQERRNLGYYSTLSKAEAELAEYLKLFPERIISDFIEDREGYKYRHTLITAAKEEYCIKEVKVE